MNSKQMIEHITCDKLSNIFTKLYGKSDNIVKNRFIDILDNFEKQFGIGREIELYSAPGRTEVGGNHTDHQHGRVLAGAVSLDVIGAVSPNDDNTIRILSEGHDMCEVKLDDLSVNKSEANSSPSLVRGIASKISEMGYSVKGFDAYTTSQVLCGSGLSSSAAFEVLVANIINQLYCNGELSPVKMAIISQYAENVYFGKPSGLMDQTACAVGGFITIDFENPEQPKVENIHFDLDKHGYKLVIVNTGANHADLTDDYSSIPADMKSVARQFDKEFLREVDENDVLQNIESLRNKISDQAILRAIHFFDDNNRVIKQASALMNDNISEFFNQVNISGASSFDYLQNVYSPHNPLEQGISLALCITRRFIKNNGACRVHGGGFAGTIQAYIRKSDIDEYVELMENIFGSGCCYVLNIRNEGTIKII